MSIVVGFMQTMPPVLFRIALVVVACTVPVLAQEEESPQQRGMTFLQKYCVECHSPPKPKSGLDLSPYAGSVERLVEDGLDWTDHLVRVREGEMPPDDEDVAQPTEEERDAFITWVETTLKDAATRDGLTPGPPMVRRLNRSEYSASVRYLLDVHFDAGEALPDEGAGGEGFDNAAETLFISPIHGEKYLEAARTAVSYAFSDTRSSERFLIARPNDERSPEDAARLVLQRFLPRAFRRPVTDNELAEYVSVFNQAYETDQAYESALQVTLAAVLVSPKFLFIIEAPNAEPNPVLLTDHEVATRLAYFLWAAPPDDDLLAVADAGKLQEPKELRRQVDRMLDRRYRRQVRQSTQNFVEQWLGTRALGREFKPDASIEGYDSELEGGMKYEPVFFVHEILSENRPLTDLIDADYTYANRRLARHYRIRGRFREQPRRVELEDQPHRGGLLGMAAVLAVSSHSHRTSPVLRGKWILETLLGEPPPPPPPDVPELEEDSEGISPQSLRERLEIHRKNPTCAACHDRIDPLGFSLENYDVLGRWREEDGGKPIDARAMLPDGTAFTGPGELKAVLLEQKDKVVRQFTRKLLGYALARGLTYEDLATVDQLVESLGQNDYHSHALLHGIVTSIPFRYKGGTDPKRGVTYSPSDFSIEDFLP